MTDISAGAPQPSAASGGEVVKQGDRSSERAWQIVAAAAAVVGPLAEMQDQARLRTLFGIGIFIMLVVGLPWLLRRFSGQRAMLWMGLRWLIYAVMAALMVLASFGLASAVAPRLGWELSLRRLEPPPVTQATSVVEAPAPTAAPAPPTQATPAQTGDATFDACMARASASSASVEEITAASAACVDAS